MKTDYGTGMMDRYEIRIEGQLNPHWSEWLGGMEITILEIGETLLSGIVSDQVALQDLLAKIRDLNIKIIAIIKQSDLDRGKQSSLIE